MSKHASILAHENCVICGFECPGEVWGRGEFPIHPKAVNNVRSGGGIIRLSFGYGSRYDTEHHYGVICDECAKTLIETAAEPFSSSGALGTSIKNTIDMRDTNDDAQDDQEDKGV